MLKYNIELINNFISEVSLTKKQIRNNDEDFIEFYNHFEILLRDKTKLTCIPPPEKHPYKNLLPLNYKCKKFIVGTFPPITYLGDKYSNLRFCNNKIIKQPKLPFYHGNKEKLWEYLLPDEIFSNLDSDRNKRVKEIINFLNKYEINYSDIIDYCQRLEYTSDDKDLYNVILNKNLLDYVSNLEENNTPIFVFNTGSLFTQQGISFSKDNKLNPKTFVFDMFVSLMQDFGKKVELKVNNGEKILISHENKTILNQYKNILCFEIFIDNFKIKVVAGPSPADGDGKIYENKIYKRFISSNYPNSNLNKGELKRKFKKFVYRTALLGNFDDLLFLNND